MQVVILTVGKRSDPGVETLVRDYEKRLSGELQILWQYIVPSKSRDALVCRQDDSSAIAKYLKSTDKVVLLDERGEQFDNAAFAREFTRLGSSQGRLVFIVGGAYGVSEALRARANVVWSLSKLVFPHRLMRLILIEQLYRTAMVIKGHPYHHD